MKLSLGKKSLKIPKG